MSAERLGGAVTIEGPGDITQAPPVSWATGRLEAAARSAALRFVAASSSATELRIVLHRAAATDAESMTAESYHLTVEEDRPGLLATIVATDERGFAYAITEVAERLAAHGLPGVEAGTDDRHVPRTPIRGVCRSFANVHHDLPWFRDRSFWPDYLDHLATQRFNRFHLAFGMHLNYGWGATGPQVATDNYLCFAYPFLFELPGHEGVRVQGVDDDERRRNLAALGFIARETQRRGMQFQLGLWNHAYDHGTTSPHWYPVLGLSRETHATYTAAAVAHLLELVPEIGGVTFRVHYEGGIPDGHTEFWEHVLQAISEVGRPIDVDLHAKGVDERIAAAACKPNLRPTLSAKYAAEHLGLPYHQASIRALEAPMPVPDGLEMMGTAEFSRRFTRYGYADFLGEDRSIDVAFRVWPGTQRLLLWGDPVFAAGYARSSTFAGATGLELSEPLFFKGRKGTGRAEDRDPYVDDDLRLGSQAWRKYAYTYLLWGRLLYDPDTDPEVWRRLLRAQFGPAADAVEAGLGALSRVLPLVTTSHMPSASNNAYWPEMYADLPISAWLHAPHYAFDTPNPTNWGAASPLDPTLFYGIDEYADAATSGTLSGRYTPLEVAGWLDQMAHRGGEAIDAIEGLAEGSQSVDPQVRRTLVDLRVLRCLARFFAGKFRAATGYALYQRTGDRVGLAGAIDILQEAHAEYARIPGIVAGIYGPTIAFGDRMTEGGHWSDRLGAMADDLRALRLELERSPDADPPGGPAPVQRRTRWRFDGDLQGPPAFTRGEPVEIRLTSRTPGIVTGATLHYRQVDQSATFRAVEMVATGGDHVAEVPGSETDSGFPLMYFVEIERDGDLPTIHPGFDETLANQPYVVLHSDLYKHR